MKKVEFKFIIKGSTRVHTCDELRKILDNVRQAADVLRVNDLHVEVVCKPLKELVE